MKLILTMPSGKTVELDEVPVHVAFHGDAEGTFVGPIRWDGYAPLVVQGTREDSALTVMNLFQPDNTPYMEWRPAISFVGGDCEIANPLIFADDCVTVDTLQAAH